MTEGVKRRLETLEDISQETSGDAGGCQRISDVKRHYEALGRFQRQGRGQRPNEKETCRCWRDRLKAAVHWVRVNALSAESSPKLTWDAMGLCADSARRLSVRAEPLTR